MPVGCAACNAGPLGTAPEVAPPLPIEFPEGATSDVQAWQRLTADAAALDVELAFWRHVRRQVYAKARPEQPKVDAVAGDVAPRAKAAAVLTPEVIAMLVGASNTLVKLQDAKTKTMRAVAELARLHRRDQRTKQLLAAKLEKLRAQAGAGRK